MFKPSLFQWRWTFALFILAPLAYASGGGATTIDFLWIAVLLLLAKFSSLIEKWGQPAVLGELLVGVLLGNLVLLGVFVFEPVKHDEIIKFLAELGVVILLFQIGLESNIDEMRKVGVRAFMVAVVGVVAPFGLGYWVGGLLMPELSTNALLFLGATLTATSVGITGRVFRDLGKLQTKEAQIVLGAAVIDDVMGLIILAIVTAIVMAPPGSGGISIGAISQISLIAVAFLAGALFLGQWIAPLIGKFLSKIHTGVGMKFTIAISFCLIFSYLAHLAGLAPIIGAFAAGLMLETVHFKSFSDPTINQEIKVAVAEANLKTRTKVDHVLEQHSERHLDNLMAPLGHFLVPIFFVVTGMQVDLTTLSDPKVVGIALAITAVAFIGKIVAGIVAGPGVNKYIVGWGMAPRGEVGLIFAMIGKGLGVMSEELFSIIIIMVILTTLLTPPILNYLLRQQKAA